MKDNLNEQEIMVLEGRKELTEAKKSDFSNKIKKIIDKIVL
jgi:hypothetical protein